MNMVNNQALDVSQADYYSIIAGINRFPVQVSVPSCPSSHFGEIENEWTPEVCGNLTLKGL